MGGTNSFEGYQKSEIILFGPSGVGKTTLLRSIAKMFDKSVIPVPAEEAMKIIMLSRNQDGVGGDCGTGVREGDITPSDLNGHRVQLSDPVLVTSFDISFQAVAAPSTNLQTTDSVSSLMRSASPIAEYIRGNRFVHGIILMIDYNVITSSHSSLPTDIGRFIRQSYHSAMLPSHLPLLILVNRYDIEIFDHTGDDLISMVTQQLGLSELKDIVMFTVLFSSFSEERTNPRTFSGRDGVICTSDPRVPFRVLLDLVPDFAQF